MVSESCNNRDTIARANDRVAAMRLNRRGLVLVASMLFFTQACRQDASDLEGQKQSPGKVVSSTAVAPDGLKIAYDVRGRGDTALVFVHCWSCDREFWREQVNVFAGEYRIVVLDLGGHGASEATRDHWTITGLAQDVVAVADELRLDRMVLIGHSMGGPVSLEAARLMTGRVLGVIAVDTLHDADFEFPAAQTEQMLAAFEADFAGTMAGMFSAMTAETMEPELRDWIVKKATAANPTVASALISDFASVNFPQMFSEAGVPIRAINAAPSAMILATNIESNRRYADYDAILMDGVGHFLQLERPAEFNAHLRSYLAELTGVP